VTSKNNKEQEEQEAQARYRFGAYHWTDTDKSVGNSPLDDYWDVPVSIEYRRSEPVWWHKQATPKQPLL